MSNRDLNPQVGILSLVAIYIAIRELTILPLYIYLYLQAIGEIHRIYDHVSQTRTKRRQEEAHRRRSREISIISTAVSTRLAQITSDETAKLEAARSEAKKRRSEDVVTIVSLVMKQILQLQAEEKRRVEQEAAKLRSQRDAERAAEQERLRQNLQRQTKLAEEKRKAEEREHLAKLEKQANYVQFLPEFLRNIDPLGGNFTCIGTTLKGQRCQQRMLSNADKAAAAIRLGIMRSNNPGNSFEQAQLLDLANWMLCPRQHRYDKHAQGMQLSREWYIELRPARDSLSVTKAALKAAPVAGGLQNGFGSPQFGHQSPERTSWTGTGFGLPVTPEKGSNAVHVSSTSTFTFGSTYSNSFTNFGSPASSIPSFGASSTNTTPNSSLGLPITPQKTFGHAFGSPASPSPSPYFGTKKADPASINGPLFGQPPSPRPAFTGNTNSTMFDP